MDGLWYSPCVGSVIVCEFDSREAMPAEWLDGEPYGLGRVREPIEIRGAKTAPFREK